MSGNRLRDDGARGIGRIDLREGLLEALHAVSVGMRDAPSEGAKFFVQRLESHDVFRLPFHLYVIPVDHQKDPRKTEMARGHSGLPHGSLLHFAVPGETCDAIRRTAHATRERHSDRDSQPHAEGAGRGVDAGSPVRNGVSLKHRAEPAIAPQLFPPEKTAVGERRVQGGASVALAQDEAVAGGGRFIFR